MIKAIALLLLLLLSSVIAGQSPSTAPAETVRAIKPPANPLPPEEATAGISRFSFLVYGDTRGRRDGRELQYEHSMVVNSMLTTIKRLEKSPFPVRFVLQTGDAVVNGRDVLQLNVSFIDLINRLTQEGNVSYFLAPGNHDLTSANSVDNPERQIGLKNYLAANGLLIPPDGSPHRLNGYPTYSFAYGNSYFIAFDSNIASDEKQFHWIRTQIEGIDKNRYHHIVLFCHHPPFSSGPHGGPRIEPSATAIRERLLPLMRKHHADLLFAGHEHLFEHWVERYEQNGRKYRIDHVITGGGGAPLYQYSGEPEITSYMKANAAEKVTLERIAKPASEPGGNPYHYVIVRVDGDHVELDVIGVDWGANFQPYRSRHADLTDPESNH